MRLTVVSFSRRKIGGTEQNLDVVLPELERRGHLLQFVYCNDEPETRAAIRTSDLTELVDVPQIGEARALDRIEEFHPDLINVHGEIAPAFQEHLLRIAPAAYSVHNYYGTCISGLKTHAFPVIQPCKRTFGPACLLYYFPRRCGGRSPITMFRRYTVERDRLDVLARYDAVITHSRHMEAEYYHHGLAPARLHGLPYEVTESSAPTHPLEPRRPVEERTRLLFVGRMEKLKGGQVLIDALPAVQQALDRPVEVHFAGDGPDREHWQTLADRVMAGHPQIAIRFHGWATGAALQDLFRDAHLLVVPSLWPEPFGKVGPEAATYGVPVAAFAVGGIEEWLIPGINGMLASGNPPTAGGLAGAIVACTLDPAVYARLCAGALANMNRFDLQTHVDALVTLFRKVCQERTATPAAVPVS